MVAPDIEGVLADFNVTSPAISSLAVTIFLLGLALGPMFFSSMGEVFGRLPVYHTANIVFIAFMVGNALSKNIAQLMVFRFLSGCAGGLPLAMGGGTIADLTIPAERGLATALFSLGPLAGPVICFHCTLMLRTDHILRCSALLLAVSLQLVKAGAGPPGCWPSSAPPLKSPPLL